MGSSISQVEPTITELLFCKLDVKSHGSAPDVCFSLQISNDFSWKAFFHGKKLSHESAVLKTLSFKLTNAEHVKKILQGLDSSRPCQGNPDDRFMALLHSRKGVLKDHSGMYYLYNTTRI